MDRPKTRLIAIVDQNWGIAKDGRQICTIPDDLKHFQGLTMGGTVIMGRKTFEAIGKPLGGRWNIVLSKKMPVTEGVTVVRVAEFLDVLLESLERENIFVIGGESIYRQLLPLCDRAYITYVDADLGADQFCPDLDSSQDWTLESASEIMTCDGLPYQFREYRRVSHGETG